MPGQRRAYCHIPPHSALARPGRFHARCHAAICADGLVEALPGVQMGVFPVPGKLFQVLERPPVLDQANPAPVENQLSTQKTFFRMPEQSLQHWPHGQSSRNPLPEGKETIDTHSNQEHNKGFISLSGIAPWHHFSHVLYLLFMLSL